MTAEERLYWIWLATRTHGGTATVNTALRCFLSPEEVWRADEAALKATGIEWRGRIGRFLDKDLSEAERIAEYCEKNSIGIITLSDYFYPERLKLIENRPVVMYYIGNFCEIDSAPCVALVGSRRPSKNGEHSAKRIAYDLSLGGAVIVSGLAAGVDALVHKAALFAGGFTIAVLGCGIDRVYPEENRPLYDEIYEKGLVLSEFAPGTPPEARNFPIRNRIISGLSAATCVIEGSLNSGSLITADYAARQKRPLYSVPSSIFIEEARGTNHLLKVGAKPLLTAYDLLLDLKRDFPDKISIKSSGEPEKKRGKSKKQHEENKGEFVFGGLKKRYGKGEEPPVFEKSKAADTVDNSPEKLSEIAERASSLDLSDDEKAVFDALSFEPKTADELNTGLSASKTLRLLTELEIKDLAESFSGGRYALRDN